MVSQAGYLDFFYNRYGFGSDLFLSLAMNKEGEEWWNSLDRETQQKYIEVATKAFQEPLLPGGEDYPSKAKHVFQLSTIDKTGKIDRGRWWSDEFNRTNFESQADYYAKILGDWHIDTFPISTGIEKKRI